MRWLAEFVGYPAGGGAFTSGGTVSNLTALAAARERALPGSRQHGVATRPAAFYASGEAHYSVSGPWSCSGSARTPCASCRWTNGTGLSRGARRGARPRPRRRHHADRGGRERRHDADGGRRPARAVAEVCAAHGVWLHVDGAYGLPAAATPSCGPLFAGVERADSVAIDAHKWLYLPKACSAVLVRSADELEAAFAHEEAYMPHEEGEPHAADLTLEYSRPFRALKLWLAFRVHGAPAFREAIDRNLGQARLLAEEVRRHLTTSSCARAAAVDRAVPSPAGRRVDVDRHNPTWPRRSRPTGASTSPPP